MFETKRVLFVGVSDIEKRVIKSKFERFDFKIRFCTMSKFDVFDSVELVRPDVIVLNNCLKIILEPGFVIELKDELDIAVIPLIEEFTADLIPSMQIIESSDVVLEFVDIDSLRFRIELAWYQHKLEKNINRNNRCLCCLVNSVDELVFSIGSDGRIRLWNASIEKLSGFGVDEVSDEVFEDNVIFDGVDRLREYIVDVFEDNVIFEKFFQIGLVSKNGERNVIRVKPLQEFYVDGDGVVSVVFVSWLGSVVGDDSVSGIGLNGVMLDGSLLELLRFVCRKDRLMYGVVFKDIKNGLGITYPTIRKRIRLLEGMGLVRVVKVGNKHCVQSSKKGKRLIDDFVF